MHRGGQGKQIQVFILGIWAAIRGFQYTRKVIGVDGTFLKGPYKGVLLVATA